MNEPDLLQDKIEKIYNILSNRATGGSYDNEEYISLRKELIANDTLKKDLPSVILNFRNLDDFWIFIQPEYSSYKERRIYLSKEFASIYKILESRQFNKSSQKQSFSYQFPIGLPFGKQKPALGLVPQQGGQKFFWEETESIIVIKEDVYPSLNYSKLINLLPHIPNLKTMLGEMSQTEMEKLFFDFYANYHNMWDNNIPVLIPQAWIQWHSSTKEYLRANNTSYENDLYRVDFIAFWNSKRYAILLDDISHYANKNYSYWNANEEKYTIRLKEDRKLRKEGWEVFRFSNWEIRNSQNLPELTLDMLTFITDT